MIEGIVNVYSEALINLTVVGVKGKRQEIEAVVDTGFNGWLSLPAILISKLDLPYRGRGRTILADGRIEIFDVYIATVIWDGQPRHVPIDAAETAPLIGMALLYGFELLVQVKHGGNVVIRRLT